MAQDNFKPGDLVELKSGGPAMTVRMTDFAADLIKRSAVLVDWFDRQGVNQRKSFAPEQLRPYFATEDSATEEPAPEEDER